MAAREKYDEAQVIEQLHNQATCKVAFSKVIEHYSSQLYWQIRRMVIDHDDANDVLQNTFLKAWTNIDNFRGDAKLSTWLYKIAINESITFVNKKKVMNQLSIDDDESFLVNQLESDEWFDGDQAQINLQKAIATLPEKQQLILYLSLDGGPPREIAKEFGCTASYVSSLLFKAKAVVRSLLENSGLAA
jgi:RNA polymerase sigma-70 factor (ECF subfamily)